MNRRHTSRIGTVRRLAFITLALASASAIASMSPLSEVAFAHAPFGQVESPPEYAPGIVLIRFASSAVNQPGFALAGETASAPTTGLLEVDALLERQSLQTVDRLAGSPRQHALATQLGIDRDFAARVGPQVDIETLAAELSALPSIEEAGPDWLARPSISPNDPLYPSQWGHDNRRQFRAWTSQCNCHGGATVGTIDFDADVDEAWSGCQGFGDPNVVIAIIDSGVDVAGTGHPDLLTTTGWDFGDGDSNPHDDTPTTSAWFGHGTACAGVAASIANNNLGAAGVAGGCSIMPLKFVDSNGVGLTSSARAALIYAADNGANIVSMSISATADVFLQGGVDYAINAGLLIFAATGNFNNATIDFPARYDSVIAIGAASPCSDRKRSNTDANGQSCDGEFWWGSNFGTGIDFLAPTIIPTTDMRGTAGYSNNDYHPFFNGTSASTPFAAGVAALILSRSPNMTRAQVKQTMIATAIDVTTAGATTGYDVQSGWGLVNVGAAVTPFVDITTSPLDDVGRGSAAWGDYDADGDPDVFLADTTTSQPSKLLRNDGAAGFTDVTSSPLGMTGSSQSAVWGDHDNDGDLDLFVSRFGDTNLLLRNDGADTFVDVTHSELGGNATNWNSFGSGFVDFDNDGELDLSVAITGNVSELHQSVGCGQFGPSIIPQSMNFGASYGVAWGDADNDGDQDLYLTNGTGNGNQLMRNDGGGSFVDVATGVLADASRNSRGAAWGDFDNDGDLDLYFANYLSGNRLLRNDGGMTFVDVTSTPESDLGPGTSVSWADFDLDADLDLYLVNDSGVANRLFRNDGPQGFVDVAFGDLADATVLTGGASWADVDTDGDLDLYVIRGGANRLLQNNAGCGNGWLRVDLVGIDSNAAAIGARVRIVTGSVTQIREVSASSGLYATSELTPHFGLGAATSIDSLIVTWPSGVVQALTALAPNRTVVVTEPTATWSDLARGRSFLCDASSSSALAWGDADGDGDQDLYIGSFDAANVLARNDGGGQFTDITTTVLGDTNRSYGAAWGDADSDGDLDLIGVNDTAPTHLYRNDGSGSFADVANTAIANTVGYHPAWADYDLDGDIDLYVVVSSAPYANKLFRNDGGMSFVDVSSAPLNDDAIGTGAAWGDYDSDGDPDLYLANTNNGGNKLLRNDGTSGFTDVTSGPLGDASQSWSASWGDADNDGDLDLFVANWGSSNKLLRNDGGNTFTDVTAGPLADTSQALSSAWGDIDLDGDLDLYVTNVEAANQLLRNDGSMSFTDIATGRLADSGWGSSVALADIESDGDLDIALTNWGQANHLLQNNTTTTNNWFQIDLVGTTSNKDGIGARVRVVTGSLSQIREIEGSSGFASQNSLTAEFGVGSATQIDTVEVRWPSGSVQVITSSGSLMPIAVNQRIEVEEVPSNLLDHADHTAGNMVLTMTDQGSIGFLGTTQTEGTGLLYPATSDNQLYIGSMWLSQGTTYVANRDYDLDPAEWAVAQDPDGHVRVENDGPADEIIHGGFDDSGADDPFGFYIRQESWAFSDPTDDDFVIVRYFIHNRGDTELTDVRAGLFLDLDLGQANENTAGTDALRDLGYMTRDGGDFIGARKLAGDESPDLLSNLTIVHNPTYVYPNEYILDADKIGFMRGDDPAYVTTTAEVNDDYSLLISVGPFSLAPGDSNEVAFAIVGGATLAELQTHADQAQARYTPTTSVDEAAATPVLVAQLHGPAPNPFNPTTNLVFELARDAVVDLSIYDTSGRLVRRLVDGRRDAGRHSLQWDGRQDSGRQVASGVYFLRFGSEGVHETRRLVLLK